MKGIKGVRATFHFHAHRPPGEGPGVRAAFRFRTHRPPGEGPGVRAAFRFRPYPCSRKGLLPRSRPTVVTGPCPEYRRVPSGKVSTWVRMLSMSVA